MRSRHCIGLGIIGIALAFKVTAGITVIPNIINFTEVDLPRKDVIVLNEGEDEIYIKVIPHILLDPGTKHERKIIIHDPEKYGLLVTPQQLILAPKQQCLVSLLLTRPLDEKESIYGVDIVPIAKEIVPPELMKKQAKNKRLPVLLGYGVLAMARPLHPQLDIQIQRQDKTLFIKNRGNANVEISSLEQCVDQICHPIKDFSRLYAGNSKQISLNFAAPVKMVIQLLDDQKILTSN